jgi:hypothetical protein
MTDAEIDALAREILTEIFNHLYETAPHVCRIHKAETGEKYLEFFGTSKLGHGSFR